MSRDGVYRLMQKYMHIFLHQSRLLNKKQQAPFFALNRNFTLPEFSHHA
jgi:hypothetical protein